MSKTTGNNPAAEVDNMTEAQVKAALERHALKKLLAETTDLGFTDKIAMSAAKQLHSLGDMAEENPLITTGIVIVSGIVVGGMVLDKLGVFDAKTVGLK